MSNRNTIPGDKSARTPSGIRLGTPWISQRGFGPKEIARLADIIANVLTACKPHAYAGRRGPVYSARIDFDTLEAAKRDTVDLVCSVDLAHYTPSGYPHHYFMYKDTTDPGGDWDIIEIAGEHARGFCNVTMTNDVYQLGRAEPAHLDSGTGWQPDEPGVLKRIGPDPHLFQLLVPKSVESRVAHWLRALSDGFVVMDTADEFVKAPGPVVVRRLPHVLADELARAPRSREAFESQDAGWPAISLTGSATRAATMRRASPSRCPLSNGLNRMRRSFNARISRCAPHRRGQDRAVRRLRDARPVYFGDG